MANFLASIAKYRTFKKKLCNSYSNVAAFRTAIGHYHQGWHGVSVGEHPLISSLIKGVFNSNPPLKKYTHVWSKDKLLDAWREKDDVSLDDWAVSDLRTGLLVRLVMSGCLRYNSITIFS